MKSGASNIDPNGYLHMQGSSDYTPMSPSIFGPPVFDTDLQQNIPTGENYDNDENSDGTAAITIGDDSTVHYTTPQFPAQSLEYLKPQLQTVAEEDEEEEDQPLLQQPTPSPQQPQNGGACAVDMSSSDNVDGVNGLNDNNKPVNGVVQLRPKTQKPPPKYDKMNGSQSEAEEYSAPPTYSVVMTGYNPTEESC